jgi:AraC family transcriptional regulator
LLKRKVSMSTAMGAVRNVSHHTGFKVEEAASCRQLREVWKTGHVILVAQPRDCAGARVSIIPSNTQFAEPCEQSGKVIAVALQPAFVTCSTASLGGARAQLRDVREVNDPLIVQLITALRAEVNKPWNEPLAEALATALAMHLVCHYSVNKAEGCDAERWLGKTRLRAVLDHINEHLAQNISIEALAKTAGLSSSHFIRMFQYATGLSPHQYILRARVLRGQELLRTTHVSIAEIARITGFCGQSHFTMHFKRVLGVTPKRYLRNVQVRSNNDGATAHLLAA